MAVVVPNKLRQVQRARLSAGSQYACHAPKPKQSQQFCSLGQPTTLVTHCQCVRLRCTAHRDPDFTLQICISRVTSNFSDTIYFLEDRFSETIVVNTNRDKRAFRRIVVGNEMRHRYNSTPFVVCSETSFML